jgi:poly(3-hydroxybutyrate) depolymerase
MASLHAGASAQSAPLNGVYAPCRSFNATPLGHYQANRATRTGSGSTTQYFARGSGTQLTATVTLSQTGKDFWEVRSSCPLPSNCTRPALQPPSGLGLRCSVSVPNQGTRHYDVHVPNNYTNLTKFPLVMEMHGGGGAAVPPATEWISTWREVSDTSPAPFLVVWPVGSGPTPTGPFGHEWQTCNYDNSTAQNPCPAVGFPNDRAFLIKVLERVDLDLKVDRRKIYATGLSSGAAMVHSLACKFSNNFAAVAPMATGIKVEDQERLRDRFDMTTNCAAAREVPHFYVHSPHDTISSFEEGEDSVAFWRTKYGCNAQSDTQILWSDVDWWDLSDLDHPDWDVTTCNAQNCGPSLSPAASRVAFCEIDGSSNQLNETGHIVWLGDDFWFHTQPQAPMLAKWAWDFMRAFTLPAQNPPWPPQ